METTSDHNGRVVEESYEHSAHKQNEVQQGCLTIETKHLFLVVDCLSYCDNESSGRVLLLPKCVGDASLRSRGISCSKILFMASKSP